MSVLFHAEIVGRDFGSHLLSVAKLTAWAQNKDLELVTLPPIDGFRFVQVEALLCAIERAVSSSTKDHEAAAIVQSTPKLVQDRAAEIAPRWLVGADAHLQWRNLIKQAVQAGELSLLNYGSKLPIQKPDTQPQVAPEAAPVVSTWESMAKKQAIEIIERDRKKDLYPSQNNIADEIARGFRADGVMGAGGKPLAGAYIKRHALKGISSEQGKQLSTTTNWGK